MLNLGPCSLLPPHWHPNAVNFVVAILGNTTTYMYQENGARLVTEVLTPGHGTIFPRASMHLMVNTGAFLPCLLACPALLCPRCTPTFPPSLPFPFLLQHIIRT